MAANKKSPISEKAGGAKSQAAGLRRAGEFYSGKGVRGGERAQAAAAAKRIAKTRVDLGLDKPTGPKTRPSAATSVRPGTTKAAASTKPTGSRPSAATSVGKGTYKAAVAASKSSKGMSTGTKVAIGAGAAIAVGAVGATGVSAARSSSASVAARPTQIATATSRSSRPGNFSAGRVSGRPAISSNARGPVQMRTTRSGNVISTPAGRTSGVRLGSSGNGGAGGGRGGRISMGGGGLKDAML